jgi:hypothetical protein
LLRNIAAPRPNVAARLRSVVFVGKASLSLRFDIQRIGLRSVAAIAVD